MKYDLTPWFPPGVAPVRVGVYQRKSPSAPDVEAGYGYWNGKFWSTWSKTPDRAHRDRGIQTAYMCDLWRGLAADPRSKEGGPT